MRSVELGYVTAGHGPTVVAVHGGLLSGRLTYGPVLADWAQRFRVLVPDRRGFERTPGVGGTIAEQARDLEAFIAAHAGGRAHVVGFSYGGVVALTALQLSRRSFASITTIEAPAVTLCGRDPKALALRVRLAALYDAAVGGSGPRAAREFFEYVDPRAMGRITALFDTDDPGLHVALDELRVWQTPLSPVGLAGSDVPALVVTGARSPDTMRRVGALVADATGGQHHVQPAAGHAAHLVGRPFRDELCAHVAAAEAARAWTDPIELVAWDPHWAERYLRERDALSDALGVAVVAVEHIGSTAIDGLEAQPVVDVMVGVTDVAAVDASPAALRRAGYAVRHDGTGTGSAAHVFGMRRADGRRLAHAHVVVHDGRWWRDGLTFRDLLRRDPDVRARYAARKRGLADRNHTDPDAFADAKAQFVRSTIGGTTAS